MCGQWPCGCTAYCGDQQTCSLAQRGKSVAVLGQDSPSGACRGRANSVCDCLGVCADEAVCLAGVPRAGVPTGGGCARCRLASAAAGAAGAVAGVAGTGKGCAHCRLAGATAGAVATPAAEVASMGDDCTRRRPTGAAVGAVAAAAAEGAGTGKGCARRWSDVTAVGADAAAAAEVAGTGGVAGPLVTPARSVRGGSGCPAAEASAGAGVDVACRRGKDAALIGRRSGSSGAEICRAKSTMCCSTS
jgi:hypothetical protein